MSREEHPREDLLREATAYRNRIELRVPWLEDSVFLGRRVDGCISLYLTQDRVIQFNRRGQVRRIYWFGIKLKADRGSMVPVLPDRWTCPREWSDRLLGDNGDLLWRELGSLVTKLRESVDAQAFEVVGSVNTLAEVTEDWWVHWLRSLEGVAGEEDRPPCGTEGPDEDQGESANPPFPVARSPRAM